MLRNRGTTPRLAIKCRCASCERINQLGEKPSNTINYNKMTHKPKIIYYRESLLQSVLSDLFTIGLPLFGVYLNHKLMGGGWVVDVFLVFPLFIFLMSIGIGARRNTVFTSWEDLEEFIKKEKEGAKI